MVLPHFRANKKGLFLNVSSVGGRITFPLISPYHSTKFAVEGFSESLQYELAPLGIGVKLIEPGAIATEFGNTMDFQHDEALTEYNAYVANVNEKFGGMMSQSSSAELVAEVIYTATTDGTNQLRYAVGADAEQLLIARKNMTDEEFVGMMNGQFA